MRIMIPKNRLSSGTDPFYSAAEAAKPPSAAWDDDRFVSKDFFDVQRLFFQFWADQASPLPLCAARG